MDLKTIIILICAIIVFIITTIIVIKIVKKPSKTKLLLSNKDIITNNSTYCKSLSKYSNLGQNYANQLFVLSDKLLYLNPVINKDIDIIDKKIKNCLDDIKLIISVDKINEKKLSDKIAILNNLIQDRDYKSKLK